VVQLAEPGPSPVQRDSRRGYLPPSVRIVGLAWRALSERALTQWRDILQADVLDGSGGGLTFRWPDSPMRILVDVDPTAAEGPLAIELASERGLAGLEEAGARLGIRLAQRSV
jgi:hypothetical protein